MKTAAIVSGGMDSVTLAYWLANKGHEVSLVSFDYGQRHRRELESARLIAERMGVEHTVIDISGIRPLLHGSSLTDDVAVPHGHYEEESMRVTVVPNRNAIMLSIAWGMACAAGADALACGVHSGDHFIYPDCRPDFIAQLNTALRTGTDGHRSESLRLLAPFIDMTKTDIAAEGGRLAVPYELTWTCYEGGEVHCGACGACVERREAFRDSGVIDPTRYKA